MEVLSKSYIITATKYSVETSELNWRCDLSCAVSLYNVWKKRNHGSTGHDQYWPVTHVTRSYLLTHLTRDPWPADPLSSLLAILSQVCSTRGARWQRPAVRRASGVLPRSLRLPLPRRHHFRNGRRQVEMAARRPWASCLQLQSATAKLHYSQDPL